MQLPKIALFFFANLAQIQSAAVAPPDVANENGLFLIHSRATDTGTVNYWGEPSADDVVWVSGGQSNTTPSNNASEAGTSTDGPKLKRRCGGEKLYCGRGQDMARTDACHALLDYLHENMDKEIPPGTRSVEHTKGTDRCVVSWQDKVPCMRQGHLIRGVIRSMWLCGSGGGVAAACDNVRLNGVCTAQCLSKEFGCRAEN